MYRIAICDDDRVTGSELEAFVLRYKLEHVIDLSVDVYESGEEMLSHMQKEGAYDLIFLNIEFPKMNGVAIGNYIRNEMKNEVTHIVYISFMLTHAMELFEVRPLNFLLKPLSASKLDAVLGKALELSSRMGCLFAYKKGWEERKVLISDILYFESISKKVRMVTTGGETFFYGALYDIYNELKDYRFFYSHKSYLVNYNHIVHFSYDMLTMSNGERIIIAQPRRKEVRVLQKQI
ncbi:MAG TPA: LytTR family DNA-binding domain-containing protein [Lachnospiraceae bacterium]|nr:LytTR family DNA-binding domain-containing protein [Lachnospiraceae bacterium]